MSYKYERSKPYKSRNTEEIDNLRQKYLDRGDFSFSYDPNKDNAYQEYAKMMRTQGSLAMEDAMGKAAASTGGYDNSYAQTIGQQTYQDYAKDISAAQSTFEDRAYDRALNAFTNEGNAILDKMGMLENRESADKAAWEEAYLNDYNKAVASGNTKDAAAVLGMSEDDYIKSSAAGKTPLGDEQIAGLAAYILNGGELEGDEYGALMEQGYDMTGIETLLNAYSKKNDLGFSVDENGTDEKGNKNYVVNFEGRKIDDVNNNISGLDTVKEGKHFKIKQSDGEAIDVQIGTAVDSANNQKIYNIAKNKGKGIVEYGGNIYYYDGNTVYTVVPYSDWITNATNLLPDWGWLKWAQTDDDYGLLHNLFK